MYDAVTTVATAISDLVQMRRHDTIAHHFRMLRRPHGIPWPPYDSLNQQLANLDLSVSAAATCGKYANKDQGHQYALYINELIEGTVRT